MAWNRPESGKAESFPLGKKESSSILKRKGFRFSLLAVAIVVIVGVWWFWPKGENAGETPPPRNNGQIKDVKPAAVAQVNTNILPKAKDPHEGCVLSPVGVWQPTNRPWRADAKKVHTVHTNWSHSAAKNVPYRNAVEQMLLATFKCPRGDCPPPYVRISQEDMEHLVEILIDKPSVSEDDTPALIKDKELIAAAKKELTEYIRKGGKPDFFFKAYHNDLQKAYEKRTAVIREISRITTEEGDAGLAKDFQDEMNRRLKKEGIRPIHMDIK